jgi:magnesium transporter
MWMISTYKQNKTTWLDLENPTVDEVRKIVEKYSIDPVVGNELLAPSNKPHINFHDNYIYLILHFPTNNSDEGNVEEVDFIIGKDFIITARYGAVDAIMQFAKVFEVNSLLDKSSVGEHSGFVFFHMITGLYKSLLDQLDHVKDLIEDTEEKVFAGQEAKMVTNISKLNRRLLNFKEAISLHYEILRTFESLGSKLFDSRFDNNLRLITSEYVKVQSSLENIREYLLEIRRNNDSLLSTKQNEIMKNLTIMAFITFPLTLLSSMFGMNADNIPIVGNIYDFWIILTIMFAIASIFFIYFKFKKWF